MGASNSKGGSEKARKDFLSTKLGELLEYAPSTGQDSATRLIKVNLTDSVEQVLRVSKKKYGFSNMACALLTFSFYRLTIYVSHCVCCGGALGIRPYESQMCRRLRYGRKQWGRITELLIPWTW
jgi:hypothetical protein